MRHARRESLSLGDGAEHLPKGRAAATLERIRRDALGASHYIEEKDSRGAIVRIHRTFAIDGKQETWTPTTIGTGADRWFILTRSE